jgi:hypothetical protein
MGRYPDAKVVLSARRNGKKWAKSFARTIGRMPGLLVRAARPFTWIPPLKKKVDAMNKWHSSMMSAVGLNEYAKNDWIGFWPLQKFSEEQLAQFEEAHDLWKKHVIESVPKDRLLVYYPGDGYQPLCTFLNIQNEKCPLGPTPRGWNTGTRFGYLIDGAELFTFFLPWILMFWLIRCCCRQPGKAKTNSRNQKID